MRFTLCLTLSHPLLDPLQLIRRLSRRDESHAGPQAAFGLDDHSERLIRERSIRSNRRQKFISCLTSDDVSMGASVTRFAVLSRHLKALCHIAQLRKLSWNGVPADLRPITWPLLLVRRRPTPSLHRTKLSLLSSGLSSITGTAARIYPCTEAFRVSILGRTHLCAE